jgi:hypothetical protein
MSAIKQVWTMKRLNFILRLFGPVDAKVIVNCELHWFLSFLMKKYFKYKLSRIIVYIIF